MQITFWAMKECLSVWLLAGTSAPYENEDDDTLSPIFTHLASPKESRPETQQFAASLETFVNDKIMLGNFLRISIIFIKKEMEIDNNVVFTLTVNHEDSNFVHFLC